MDLKDAAAIFDGIEYRSHTIIPEDQNLLKSSGIVAIYGESDDTMRSTGAFDEEFGAYNGGTAIFFKNGALVPRCEDPDCPYERMISKLGTQIYLDWCPDGFEGCWKARATIPHETFRIWEDGEIYCEGLVFRLSDCADNPLPGV